MYSRPFVIGIDASSIPAGASTQNRLASLGLNTGNMLFSEALFSRIANAKRGKYDFTPADIEDCDVIVVAAANWLATRAEYESLAASLEQSALPCVVVGIGAQSDMSHEIPALRDSAKRLIKLFSDRSVALSVRGAFTSEVLEHYGIRNAWITGCPSLLLNGPKPNYLTPPPSNLALKDVLLHGSRHQFHAGDKFNQSLYRIAMSSGSDLLLQSEYADILTASEELDESVESRRTETLTAVYGDKTAAEEYLRQHGRTWFNLPDWIQGVSRYPFSVGTRLHGTVAALLAGVPACLIAHDSRTLEAGRTLNLPVVLESELNLDDPNALLSLYDTNALDRYRIGYEQYLRNFKAFFYINGIQTTGI